MIGDENNIVSYRVTYRTRQEAKAGKVDRHEIRVDLYPGYTGLGDVPRIIAAAKGCLAADVIVLFMDLVLLVVEGERL